MLDMMVCCSLVLLSCIIISEGFFSNINHISKNFQLNALKYDPADFIQLSISKPLGHKLLRLCSFFNHVFYVGLSLEEVQPDGKAGLYIEDIDDGNAKKSGKLYKGLLLISANGIDVKASNFDEVMDILVNAPADKPLDLVFIDPRKVERGPAIITVITPDKKQLSISSLKGQNLRTVLLGSQIDLYSGKAKFTNCAGGGQCGTCVVRVTNNPDWEVKPEFETKKLKKYDEFSRLSCNTIIEGDCTVELQPEKLIS